MRVACQVDGEGHEYLHLCVEDTGPGISVEQQARVFRPFIQGSPLTAAEHGGTGLGLSICQQLVDLMGGQITLRSTLGEGTTVCIDLRLDRVGSDDLPAPVAAASLLPADRALSVLIVDDLSANRLVLAQQLQFLGHQVVAVHSAEAALQRWRSEAFDVLVTDCHMPGMSGFALAEAIRQIEAQEQRPRCALVGCTADAQEDEGQRGQRAGMDALLVKPVTLEQWNQVLARVTAVPAFDLQALRKMTQADGPILQSMLQELANNLEHEHYLLGHAMAEHDLAQLRASLHRLKGICCLVDALPLAKACIALESSAREYREDELAQRWQNVCVAIRVLQEQIRPYLNRQE